MFGGFPKHFFIRVRGARIFLKGNARRVRAQVGAVSFFILESWLIRLPWYGVVHTRKVKKIWQKNLKKSTNLSQDLSDQAT